MKQLLFRLCKRNFIFSHSFFLLIALLFSSNVLCAEDLSIYDNTTWNVIRERLFNGENTKAYRFEEDIRFQVIGAKNQQDSAIFTQLIDELNELMETVQITMVDKDPNFKLTIENNPGGMSTSYSQDFSGSKITKVDLGIGSNLPLSDSQSINGIYFFTVRHLTKLFPPRNGRTVYEGILDNELILRPQNVVFKEIDKNVIRHLYSENFYQKLKTTIVNREGYEAYLKLRYDKLSNNLLIAFRLVLLIIGFLYYLLVESKRFKKPGLFLYLKQRAIILLFIPFFYSTIGISHNVLIFAISRPFIFLINYLLSIIIAIHFLFFIYYTEKKIFERIKTFIGQQVIILLTTISAGFMLPILFNALANIVNSLIKFGTMPISIWRNPSTSWLLFILSIAILRIFYNIITYRIQSMVNQKDVEIAKMKELKNQAELNALHSRINPHFLYNSLNSIASLAHIDANKTETMATGLSELFRYSINKENKTFVTVAEELEMVNKYLEIEKTRFGDRLIYEINSDESTLNKQIPKFMIQPLVENAIKHGLSKIKETGRILVEIKQMGKDLIIFIFDNGPDFPAEPVSGYGLQNLNDKLDIIYGDKASINWENGNNKHFKITLKNQF
nr:histidine kinase [uncultured Carboxylicivirga sp.]